MKRLYCRMLALSALLLPIAACDEVSDASRVASGSAKQVIHDTKSEWRDLFTYSPRPKTNVLPQTRYCYKTQADIACYDSAQNTMISPLVGYQDGENFSFFQPGGGSVGYSDGRATSIYTAQDLKPVTSDMITVDAAPVNNEIAVSPNPAPFKKAVK